MDIRRLSVNATEIRLLNRAAKAKADAADEDEDTDADDDDDDEDRSGPVVAGYAIVFDSNSEDLGGFVERVSPNAVKRSVDAANAGEGNVYAYWAHDPSQPIGSTQSKSLRLKSDDKGLSFELDPAGMNDQQRAAVSRGDMRVSFGFTVKDDTWDQTPTGDYIRTLNDVELFEISPVTSPAYSATSAGMRDLGNIQEARASFDAFKAKQSDLSNKYKSNGVELKLRVAQLMEKLISTKTYKEQK